MHHPIKRSIWQRWMAWSGSFLVLSILVHLLLIGGATVLIVQVVQGRKEKLKFTAAPPSSAGPAEHKVKPTKKTSAAAPAVSKRITSTAINASVALPAMDINASTSPDLMASVMSGMGASGLGAGAGSGAGAGMASMPLGGLTAFGFKGKANDGLTGTFYDLKQTSDGKPTDMTYSDVEEAAPDNFDVKGWKTSKQTQRYIEVVKQFAKSGWNPAVLEPYFKAPGKMTAYQILVPPMKAVEATKAFEVQNVCKPMRWLIHYKGNFSSPKDGEFRFTGMGDDILMVRVAGKLVLDANLSPQSVDAAEQGSKLGVMLGTPPNAMRQGAWFPLRAGEKTPIEVLIGEGPGGGHSQFLGIENRPSTNNYYDAWPAFQLKDIPLPIGDKGQPAVWRDRAPKNFKDQKMVFKS